VRITPHRCYIETSALKKIKKNLDMESKNLLHRGKSGNVSLVRKPFVWRQEEPGD
jgi:hypothetical protein